MNYTVQFAPEAQAQLDELEDFIAQAASPTIAARYVDAIVAYCQSLATFPQRGMRRDDLRPGLRVTHYRKRAVIAFVVDAVARQVSILGIFYGGRDHEAVLREPHDDATEPAR